MGGTCTPDTELQNSKKLMEGRILGGRPVGRSRRRRIDAVCQGAREQLGVRRWRREAEDRKIWGAFNWRGQGSAMRERESNVM
jgi:hypothetical protein